MTSPQFTWAWTQDGNLRVREVGSERTGYYRWAVADERLPLVVGDDLLPRGAFRLIHSQVLTGAREGTITVNGYDEPVRWWHCLICGEKGYEAGIAVCWDHRYAHFADQTPREWSEAEHLHPCPECGQMTDTRSPHDHDNCE